MTNTKRQLEWEIKVLRLALQKCDAAYLEHGTQYWVEEAGMELTRASCAEGLAEGKARSVAMPMPKNAFGEPYTPC